MKNRFVPLLLGSLLSGCAAVSVTPPLDVATARGPGVRGDVLLTSGGFEQPHEVIGFVQMRQDGYKWAYEVELNPDADPGSILHQVAVYAREHGAQGVQYLELVDENPQTPYEQRSKQVEMAINVADEVRSGQKPRSASDGIETRYRVKGELVVFVDGR